MHTVPHHTSHTHAHTGQAAHLSVALRKRSPGPRQWVALRKDTTTLLACRGPRVHVCACACARVCVRVCVWGGGRVRVCARVYECALQMSTLFRAWHCLPVLV